jgi:DNA repair protein RecO (recombination protein O)
MKPRSYSSEGIILNKYDSNEADRIFVVLAKRYGKIKLLAKGVRKIKSRKRGHLEVFSKVKFSANSLTGIDLVTEAELIDDYPVLRKNLTKMSLAYYFCEVVNKILREGEGNDRVFSLLNNYLERLQIETKLKNLRINFVRELLINLGYWSEEKEIPDADDALSEVLERGLHSSKIGRKMLL